jgi:hypothetical protein
MDVANAENAGAQSAKEKYPKESRPMPLASCALTFLPEGTSLSLWQSAA